MELWACGFNAWGQLDFAGEQSDEPRDVFGFRCVLAAGEIEWVCSSISGTLVSTSSSAESIRVAGLLDDLQNYIVGDTLPKPEAFVQAGNGKFVFYADGSVTEYSGWRTFPREGKRRLEGEHIKQLVANQTSFFALTTAGTVWSWGDERYGSCLGREIDSSKPASSPSPVCQLYDLPGGPIVKVASGGYLTAALTVDNDLYVWGGRPGETPIIAEIEEQTPTPLNIHDHDILDFGIGDRHMIVLTTDRKLFVIGEGVNGQLGSQESMATEWLELTLSLPQGKEVVGVAAGPKSSFLLVSTAGA